MSYGKNAILCGNCNFYDNFRVQFILTDCGKFKNALGNTLHKHCKQTLNTATTTFQNTFQYFNILMG